MKNNQEFVFERNRYYSGKLLTSADFQTEQQYMNYKRWFINRTMFGKGIVWGCSVNNIDDLSLMIESGAIIDASGREIIIPHDDIKKLSAIEGFDRIESGSAYLCVVYDEEAVNPVYAASREEEQLEYNHISEGYRLILIDELDMAEKFSMESEFFTEGILYKDADYCLRVVMPAAVCMGRYARIDFELRKTGDDSGKFSYTGNFQMSSFEDMEGRQEYKLKIDDNGMKKGELRKKELWIKVKSSADKNVKIVLEPNTAICYVNYMRADIKENLILDIAIEKADPRELVDSILGRTSLEMRNMLMQEEPVCLARIYLDITEQGYMISSIEEKSVKKYIEVPADGAVRSSFLDYFSIYRPDGKKVNKRAAADYGREFQEGSDNMWEGVFDIPLGKGAKKGEVFYSGDIVYGKAGESVYISLGFDAEEENSIGTDSVTVFGCGSIFKEAGKTGLPAAETAIKVYRDKGVFQAGVRFLKDYDSVMLKCRWTAVRLHEQEKALENKRENGSIAMERSTLIMKPKESVCLQVKYIDMEPCQVTFSVESFAGGEVTENGVYTAPNSEGVYEINVCCTDKPFINTFCYAVVKR